MESETIGRKRSSRPSRGPHQHGGSIMWTLGIFIGLRIDCADPSLLAQSISSFFWLPTMATPI